MKKPSSILAIDQGTTGTRAVLYGHDAKRLSSAYLEYPQYYPKPGWVEHDPLEIWNSTVSVIKTALDRSRISPADIAAIGITNQRETTVLWDRKTGKPVHRAIVWQDRRTTDFCAALKKRGFEKIFRDKTGLVLDPYFSGTKIHWLLNHVPGLKAKAAKGDILFGTVDTWLLWKLTGGKSHATDYTNASRTLIFNIRTRKWDSQLLKIFDIQKAMLPDVRDSGADFGRTVAIPKAGLIAGIPVRAMIGDQQSALYGQACYKAGEAKNTYGTGCFMVLNLGPKYPKPLHGLLTTLACDEKGKSVYALEGAVFIAGAAIQWLRDGLRLFKKAPETFRMATSVKDNGGVVFIPALTGLGSPYWNPNARGVISGLTRGTKREHLVRAALEGIAQQTADVLELMEEKSAHKPHDLKVDGGATANRFLMQFQADLLGLPVLVTDIPESTVWGAAKLAGLSSGFWPSLSTIDHRRKYLRFKPKISRTQASGLRTLWKQEMGKLLSRS